MAFPGELHPNARLSANEIRLIRHEYKVGKALRAEAKQYSYRGLSDKFGVQPQTVYDIVVYRSYRNVRDTEVICDLCGADFEGLDVYQQMRHVCELKFTKKKI